MINPSLDQRYAKPSMALRVKLKPMKLATTALIRAIAVEGRFSSGNKGSIALKNTPKEKLIR